MAKIQYVIGLGFGDEGKGNTVQYLCKESIRKNEKCIVVRYCSGPQAGHTVFNNGITHVCSSFGSGVLLGIPTYIYPLYNQTLIDPIALKAEYDVLVQKGITPEFYIHPDCILITPYDVIANRSDKEALENGTCGCGIWWATQNPAIIGTCSLYPNDLDELLEMSRKRWNLKQNISLETAFKEAISFIEPHLDMFVPNYDTYIMESAQGLLLDNERGFKPYVTPCEIFPHNEDVLLNPFFRIEKDDVEVYLITRTYTTRHGAGYEPEQILKNHLNLDIFEANKNNKYQGNFKTGLLDFEILNKGIQRHCLDNYNVNYNLVVTHCDCLNKIESLYEFPYIKSDKIVGYEVLDEKISKFIAKNLNLEFKYLYESWDFKSNLIQTW